MEQTDNSRFPRFICCHKRLAVLCEWIGEHWLMVVIYTLFAAVVLCMINLTVMALET
jgi:hypothetical protein